MSRFLLVPMILLGCLVPQAAMALRTHPAAAGDARPSHLIGVDSVTVCRDDDSVHVALRLDLSRLDVGKSELLWFTPRLVGDADSLDLPALCLYGRNPYYSYARSGPFAVEADLQLRADAGALPASFAYAHNVAFRPWMEQASLVWTCSATNPCGDVADSAAVVRHTAYVVPPTVIAAPPILDERKYTFSGSAYVDFVVNQTDILPDYHNNAAELGKICAQLDSVVHDTLATIHGMTIHGYASPEGSYEHNTDLARDRTKALRDFLTQLYGFPEGFIVTDYTPEDWDGFRRYVEQSDLPHRKQILALIDLDMDPDAKLRKIQWQYGREYKLILRDCFPFLRHSDYTIDFTRKELIERPGEVDTIYVMPRAAGLDPAEPQPRLTSYRPWVALKTNLLFDLALAFNGEVEVPFGRDGRYSAMAEWWTPWYVWHHNSRAYEFQMLGFELRRWFRSCPVAQSPLSGKFLGAYYSNGQYDLEWGSIGNQGEFQSVGATAGYSWVLSRHFNLEASFSLGAFWGPRRHYHGMFDDTHLIWQYTGRTFYFGPTKAKISIAWLLGPRNKQ